MSNWRFVFTPKAEKQFYKLDFSVQKRILLCVKQLESANDPRSIGKSLKGTHSEYWRYRVGNYRLLCSIEDHLLRIVGVKVGHRNDVYDHAP
ncbi:MAG: hypothetical protein NEHIOOID_01295 [Holosporales bacterium]